MTKTFTSKPASTTSLPIPKTALVAAGGTGGHIFPALALAKHLQQQGWQVVWLGAKIGMENKIVPANGLDLLTIDFGGLRGKGWVTVVCLPWRLLQALWQTHCIFRSHQPAVVITFGGYVTVPAGCVALVHRKPILVHEQNAVAGLSNKLLSVWATRCFSAFPNVFFSKNKLQSPKFQKMQWIGNPLRHGFLHQPEPAVRFANRQGALNVVVVGGSLGAKFLNELLPAALAILQKTPPAMGMPNVLHQSGAQQLIALQDLYAESGLSVALSSEFEAATDVPKPHIQLTAFIDDTATAFANADLVICRAGASTVTELAALGVAAILVPYPTAVDDHQTRNAMHLVDAGAALLAPQSRFTAVDLAKLLFELDRVTLLSWAKNAHDSRCRHNTLQIISETCTALTRGKFT